MHKSLFLLCLTIWVWAGFLTVPNCLKVPKPHIYPIKPLTVFLMSQNPKSVYIGVKLSTEFVRVDIYDAEILTILKI
jgi:hypothetical protein